MIAAASSLRGPGQGDYEIFALHFTWAVGMRTSLHEDRGFELILVVASGERPTKLREPLKMRNTIPLVPR